MTGRGLSWDGGARVPTSNCTRVSTRYPYARLALDGSVLTLTIKPGLLSKVSRRRAREAALRLSPDDVAVVFLVRPSLSLWVRGVGIGRHGHRPTYFWRRRGRHDILKALETAGFAVSWEERRTSLVGDEARMP